MFLVIELHWERGFLLVASETKGIYISKSKEVIRT